MTLVLALSTPRFCAMASDRSVTLVDPTSHRYAGPHDPRANKTVVLVTIDAVVSIGYAGTAYLNGQPTDRWIAEVTSPNANHISQGIFGRKARCRLRLHQVCSRLRSELSAVPGGAGVELLMVGWRLRRNRVHPINVQLKAAASLTSAADLVLRRQWRNRACIRAIGYQPSEAELFEEISRHAPPRSAEDMVVAFTALIRQVAARVPTVGPDVMSVVLPPPHLRRVVCCFDPHFEHYADATIHGQEVQVPVAYSPWVVTPSGFAAPSEMTCEPGGASAVGLGGWEFEFRHVPRGEVPELRAHRTRMQPRKPPPK